MTAEHRRYLLVETAIGAAINGALSLLFVLLVFGRERLVPVRGAHGLIVDAAPQTFMVAFMSLLVPTILTRMRRRRGDLVTVVASGAAASPHPLKRALAGAASATLAGMALHLLLLPLGPARWPLAAVVAGKVLYGAVLGAALSYIAVRLALGDDA